MERYWLTTHWPRLKREPHRFSVYFQQKFEDVARQLHRNDRVLFYETVTGKILLESLPDGTQRPLPRERGRGGIVATGTFSGSYHPLAAVQQYADGTEMNWAWEVPVGDHDFEGFVRRDEVVRVLGFEPKYYMRGFGIRGSGVKELAAGQFTELAALFKAHDRLRQ